MKTVRFIAITSEEVRRANEVEKMAKMNKSLNIPVLDYVALNQELLHWKALPSSNFDTAL